MTELKDFNEVRVGSFDENTEKRLNNSLGSLQVRRIEALQII